MRAALLISLKDLRQRVRDRSVFLWGIVAPFGLAAIFGLVLGDVADPTSFDVRYAVADLDGGIQARGFIEQVLVPLDEAGLFEVVEVDGADEAEDMAGDGTVAAAFVVPEGFTSAVEGGGSAAIEVIGNVDSPTFSAVARSIAGQYAGEINTVGVAVLTAIRAEGGVPGADDLADLIPAAQATDSPIILSDAEAASKQLSSETFYSAGMAVMFLFLIVQFGVLGLLEERHNSTMGRLLAAPIHRQAIFGGKVLTSFLLGVISMTVLIVTTTQLLDASWGDWRGVAVMVIAGVLSALGVLFVVAAFANSPEQATNLQAIIAFVLAMLGGAFFPLPQEGIIGRLSLLTPHAWFLRGLGDLASGEAFTVVLPAAGAMLAFGLVAGVAASFRVGRVIRP